ncbi:MAG: hypothetical protein A4E65_02146 [Syntrophorhabdus sp. PtaU1.Bin153]|nr:MAG: hypothetical protein A4E65_02146 [Syntrophorhabdus sp. PtaU1.Bin153]
MNIVRAIDRISSTDHCTVFTALVAEVASHNDCSMSARYRSSCISEGTFSPLSFSPFDPRDTTWTSTCEVIFFPFWDAILCSVQSIPDRWRVENG